MTDDETIEVARRLYANDTPGDKLARRLIKIAENSANWSALREKDKEISTLKAQRDELWNQITPLKDAVLYARAQRRPLGIGQDSDKALTSTTLRLGVQFGRERHADGFWIECDELGPQDKDNPNPATRIAFELLRLAYAIADKVRS